MSPSRLRNAVRLMLLVQHRSGFLQIYFGVTFTTILIVRLFLPETLVEHRRARTPSG